ncbi:DUF3560 domain-containing protein [Poseidonibacter ostreae]|uniref:DUF3560 domain-containing protein n=1 Tax=Poseidonibacter ostreae TaxID=2654171 RepID=A0A6L4WZP5_9BACT|nr:DUF3560 domain-containing protein [Poseidonibacter ostreae]
MNKFKKYCENTFVAECETEHKREDLIILTTKYGKEVECEVFNLVASVNNKFYYSIVRTDDKSYAQRKAEKYKASATKHEAKSTEWYEKSQEGRDFLSLGEPIKIGHHSEARHRKLIDANWNRLGKSVVESEKAEEAKNKASYWEDKAEEINLSMPDSLEFYLYKLEEAKKRHQGLKDGSIKREHSYSLQYANKDVKNLTKKVALAQKLWAS